MPVIVAVVFSLLCCMALPSFAQTSSENPKKPPIPGSKPVPSALPAESDSTLLPYDSLATDSLADQRRRRQRSAPAFVPDTTAPAPALFPAMRFERDVFWRISYKDAGEAIGIAPGLFPRQSSYYAEPFHLTPPGGDGRDLLVLYRGRPFNDPVTGAATMSAFAVEEMASYDLSPTWSGVGPSSSGPVLKLNQPYRYPVKPMTRVIYRQGFYGLGHADWRIQQKVSPYFRYYFGLDYGQYEGRKPNTDSQPTWIRLGGRQKLYDWGYLDFAWMQNRIEYGYADRSGIRRTHRNDVDLAFTRNTHGDSLRWTAAGWYVRSERKYYRGKEDGNRLGFRFNHQRQLTNREVELQLDVERTAALFGTFPVIENPKGDRTVAGLTASDKLTLDLFTAGLSLRAETGNRAEKADGSGERWLTRFGGTVNAELGDSTGHGLLGLATLGWRWPSLDESYGFWKTNTPERYVDLFPVPDSILSYSGNGALDPVGGLFAGGGYRYRINERYHLRVMAGYRKYIDPINVVMTAPKTYTRETGDDVDGLEVTGFAWLPVWGPFSTTGSWTMSSLPDEGVPIPNEWGFAGLRYEQFFYNGQLRWRATADARYWGDYTYLGVTEEGRWHFNGMISAKVLSFEVYFGYNNFLSNLYEFQPGYPSMFREEFWGVRWTLWN